MRKEIYLKINNLEQNKAVQKVCFENGIFWNATDKEEYKNFNANYIFIHEHAIKWDLKLNFDHPFEKINTDLFIATNGTCNLEDLYSNKDIRKNLTFETVLVTKLNGNIVGEETMVRDINLLVNDVVKCISLNEDNHSTIEIGKEYVVMKIDEFDYPNISVGELSECGTYISEIERSWCEEDQLEFIGRVVTTKNGGYEVKYNEETTNV